MYLPPPNCPQTQPSRRFFRALTRAILLGRKGSWHHHRPWPPLRMARPCRSQVCVTLSVHAFVATIPRDALCMYSNMINGYTRLMVTKLDVLTGIQDIKVAVK